MSSHLSFLRRIRKLPVIEYRELENRLRNRDKSREDKASEKQLYDKRVNCMECEFYFNKVFFLKRMFFLMCLKCRQGMRYWNVLERTSLWDCIKPCYSKCGLWISNMGNT